MVGIIQNLFGISEATVEDYFNINIKASPYLNETDSFAKVQAVMPKNIDTKKGERIFAPSGINTISFQTT